MTNTTFCSSLYSNEVLPVWPAGLSSLNLNRKYIELELDYKDILHSIQNINAYMIFDIVICDMLCVIVTSWSQPIRAQYLDSSRPILLLHSDQTNLLAGEGEVVWDEVERSERRSEPSPRVPGPEQRDIREGYKVGNI